ncbi:hypothetical protein PM082_004096 [Marasmius tenuissimus]|nr:hypothetical protein PM082_004096 [Marasmius tenuissimus]
MLDLYDEWNSIDDLLSTEKFATCAVELVVPPLTSEGNLVISLRKAFPKVDHTRGISVFRAPLKTMDDFRTETYDFYVKEEMEWVCNRQY